MPAMPRPKSKATKIAYEILGVPAPMRYKPTPKEKELDKRLINYEISVNK